MIVMIIMIMIIIIMLSIDRNNDNIADNGYYTFNDDKDDIKFEWYQQIYVENVNNN